MRENVTEATREALIAIAFATDAYLIAEAEDADATADPACIARQRVNEAYDRLFKAIRGLDFPCMCWTDENEWRPCPSSLCERFDHDHRLAVMPESRFHGGS